MEEKRARLGDRLGSCFNRPGARVDSYRACCKTSHSAQPPEKEPYDLSTTLYLLVKMPPDSLLKKDIVRGHLPDTVLNFPEEIFLLHDIKVVFRLTPSNVEIPSFSTKYLCNAEHTPCVVMTLTVNAVFALLCGYRCG